MSTPSKNPFKKPPYAKTGDKDPDAIKLAVGAALSTWEHTEERFAALFGTIIRPNYNSYAARRAYGAIASARGRADVLKAVGAVFFLNFPSQETETTFRELMTQYGDAGSRRNELAHGIIGSDANENQVFGYFVVPSLWNSNKRGLRSEIKYRYAAKDIKALDGNFSWLGGQAIHVLDQIDEVFAASPEKLRKRW